MDIQTLLPYWPYALASIVVVLMLVGVVVLVAIYHKALVGSFIRLITSVKKGVFNRETLYWTVNITFMAFSAYHAAPFYASVSVNILGMDWFAPFVGITAALTLDALVIVFQNARKRASYKHDRKRERMYMRYIAACCGMNSVANIYTNYQHFDVTKYTNFWSIALDVAPIFLSLFPLFIMGMSNALEEMSSSTALDTLDVEAFKKDEEKRVGLVEAQAAFQKREVKADRLLIEIEKERKENERLRRGKSPKVKRVFFLTPLLWRVPVQEDYAKALEIATQEHQKNVAEMQAKYDVQIAALTEQITSLSTTLPTTREASLSANNRRRQNVGGHVASYDARTSVVTSQVTTPERQTDEMPIVGNIDAQNDGEGIEKTTEKKPTSLFGKKRVNPALRKVRNLKRRYPDMGPTELAKKADLSRSYVSDLLKQLNEVAV